MADKEFANRYDDPKEAIGLLARMSFDAADVGAGDFSPAHRKYACTIGVGGHEFHTHYQSNPDVHGQPTLSGVLSALLSDALALQGLTVDDFADELGFDRPSQAIRAYEECQETAAWLRDEIGLSWDDILALSQTLDDDRSGIEEGVAQRQREQAEREAFERPEVPEGYLSLDVLMECLDLGDFGDQCTDYGGTYLSDTFSEVADANVDIYYSNLYKWLPDNAHWVEAAEAEGLLEGCKGDITKMIQAAQYMCYRDDLYRHHEDIAKYVALDALKEQGLYAVTQELADMLSDDIDWTGHDDVVVLCDQAKDLIERELLDAMEDATDGNVYECGYDEVNPCAMSASAIRMVNEMGYEAAFAEQWKEVLQGDEADRDVGSNPASLKETAHKCSAMSEALDNDRDAGRIGQGKDARAGER